MLIFRAWGEAYIVQRFSRNERIKPLLKGLYQKLLYFPHHICRKSTRASGTLCSCQTLDQIVVMQATPTTTTKLLDSNSRVQIQKRKVTTERGDGGKNPMNGFLLSPLLGDE